MHRCVIYIYIEFINLCYKSCTVSGTCHRGSRTSFVNLDKQYSVLKPAFGMSTAGPGSSQRYLGRGQRVPLPLGGHVHLLQHISPHHAERPCFCHPGGRGQCAQTPEPIWSSACLFQGERESYLKPILTETLGADGTFLKDAGPCLIPPSSLQSLLHTACVLCSVCSVMSDSL